jgi:hypothetical protein
MYIKDLSQDKSKNVRKFTSQSDCYSYLTNEVFLKEDFIRHVTDTAKANNVSYIVAYTVITNYLNNILYEVDTQIISKRKKSKIRIHSYFSILIGFRLNASKRLYSYLKTVQK